MTDGFQRKPKPWVDDLRDRLLDATIQGRGVRLSTQEAGLVNFAFDILGQHFSGAWYPEHVVDNDE